MRRRFIIPCLTVDNRKHMADGQPPHGHDGFPRIEARAADDVKTVTVYHNSGCGTGEWDCWVMVEFRKEGAGLPMLQISSEGIGGTIDRATISPPLTRALAWGLMSDLLDWLANKHRGTFDVNWWLNGHIFNQPDLWDEAKRACEAFMVYVRGERERGAPTPFPGGGGVEH